jgi:uncharacterized protein YceH (UPF0502 family)
MDAPSPASPPAQPAGPRWRALERNERRVVGVLAEKAKTTPDAYPMTVNALINGSNQKNNRFPQTQLDEGQVLDALEGLRRAGAVALIQGDGRAEKYRHLLYDWLGVDKVELAVMTELLLRGAQTMGELRGRAARMEPIRDMGELVPIVDRLRDKGLVLYLSSPGRGAVVTHNLYQPQELAKVKADNASAVAAAESNAAAAPPSAGSAMPRPVAGPAADVVPARPVTPAPAAAPSSPRELDQLRADVAQLKRECAELREHADGELAALRRELEDLKQQLGA